MRRARRRGVAPWRRWRRRPVRRGTRRARSTKLASASARPGSVHECTGGDRLPAGEVGGALGIPSPEQIDAGDGEAVVHGRPREPVRPPARSPARRAARAAADRRRRGRDSRPGRPGDRPTSGRCRSRIRRLATSASRRGAPPIASSASGRAAPARRTMATRSPPRPHFDGSSTVSASAAANGGVEGVAAVAHRRAARPGRPAEPPRTRRRWRRARCTARPSPLNSRSRHHRLSGVERARSACARRTKPLSETRAAARPWPGRAGGTPCRQRSCHSSPTARRPPLGSRRGRR